METTPNLGDRLRRFFAKVYRRAALPYLAAALLIMVAVLIGGREIEHHIHGIEAWITKLGPWGVIAFIGVFAVTTSLLLPDSVLSIIAGAIFGVGWGIAAVVTGALLAGAIQFALSRKLLRARIQRMLTSKPSLEAIQRAVKKDELRLQLLLRLTPINPAPISYLLGAAGGAFPGFLLACLALAPNLAIAVYFGHVGKNAALLANHSAREAQWHDFAALGGLLIGVTGIVIVSKIAHRAVLNAINEMDPGK